MNNFVNELKKYFEETPREQVLKDWDKTRQFDNSQPSSTTSSDEKILYWAKQLEHKSLSAAQLVENVEWLIKQINK